MLYPEHLIDYEKIAYYFEGEWGQQARSPGVHSTDPSRLPGVDGYWLENEVLFYYERGPGFATLHDNRPLQDGAEPAGAQDRSGRNTVPDLSLL